MTQISAGMPGQIWAVNFAGEIYRFAGLSQEQRNNTRWQKISGNLKRVEAGAYSVWGVSVNGTVHFRENVTVRSPSGSKWKHIEGRLLNQISVSSDSNAVWGVDSTDHVFHRTGISKTNPAGSGWKRVFGELRSIAVGQNSVWGVNRLGNMFRRIGVTAENPMGVRWQQVPGNASMVSVGFGELWMANDEGTWYTTDTADKPWALVNTFGLSTIKSIAAGGPTGVWVVNKLGKVFNAKNLESWSRVWGKLKQLSVGWNGQVWGVQDNDDIYVRENVTSGNFTGSGWRKICCKLSSVSAGGRAVWGVQKGDKIYRRTGINESKPFGTAWKRIGGVLKQVSVGHFDQIWGVNSEHQVFLRTNVTSENPDGDSWHMVDGGGEPWTHVSVGEVAVWAVTRDGKIYRRVGVDREIQGSGWELIEHGSMNHISVGSGDQIWGIDRDNHILRWDETSGWTGDTRTSLTYIDIDS